MFQLDYRSGISICDQIVNNIIRLRSLKVLTSGAVLPSVRAMASKLAVNPNTVQKAYNILEAKGIIYTIRGKGCFISDDKDGQTAMLNNAKSEFLKATKDALRLGIPPEELIEIINSQKEDSI